MEKKHTAQRMAQSVGMTAEEEKQAIRDYAERWRRVAPILEEERKSRIRNMNTMEFIEATSDLYDFCLRTMAPRLTSGLVIQQAIFRKIAGK